jgi:hypothetical protein
VPLEARYANYFSIGQSKCEIVLDFGQSYEGGVEPAPHTRIITNPLGATRLLDLLKESLRSYAEEHGPIREPKTP